MRVIVVVFSTLVAMVFLHKAACLFQDPEFSRKLVNAMGKDTFVITVKNILPRWDKHGSEEVLFHLKIRESRQIFTVILNRSKHIVRIVKEDLNSVSSQVLKIKDLDEDTKIKSLVFGINQKQPEAHALIFMNCEYNGMMNITPSPHDIFKKRTVLHIAAFRPRRYVYEVEEKQCLKGVLKKLCPNHQLDTMFKPNGTYRNQPMNHDQLGEGDIPPLHNLDAVTLMKTINELLITVRDLKRNVKDALLTLEKCDACRKNPKPFSSKFLDATPRKYTCDGIDCRIAHTCEEDPCYPGVPCYATVEGHRCGECPHGYDGDGKNCRRINGCDNLEECQTEDHCQRNPCPLGSQCTPIVDRPYYSCSPNPPNIPSSASASSIKICELAKPCDPRVRCMNLYPGFRCDPCPSGFTGRGSKGISGESLEEANKNQQQCIDIDECAVSNGGCGPNSQCINSEGSYRCE